MKIIGNLIFFPIRPNELIWRFRSKVMIEKLKGCPDNNRSTFCTSINFELNLQKFQISFKFGLRESASSPCRST